MARPTTERRLSAVEMAMADLVATLKSLEEARAQERAQERAERAQERADQAEAEKRRADERAAEEKRRAAVAEAETRALNKKLAEISDRQGRLVEDIVAPSVPAVVAAMFDLGAEDPLDMHFVRWKLRARGETREIDVLAGFPGHVLVVEVKSTLRPGDVRDFVAGLPSLRPVLPVICADRKVIGAVASLHFDESLLRFAENQGLVVMGLGDHLMESKNQEGFVPRGS